MMRNKLIINRIRSSSRSRHEGHLSMELRHVPLGQDGPDRHGATRRATEAIFSKGGFKLDSMASHIANTNFLHRQYALATWATR